MESVQSLLSLLTRNLLGNLDLVALFGAYYLMSHMVKLRAVSRGLDPNTVADMSFWIAVGAVVGGRLAYTLPAIQSYLAHPVDFARINTGMYLYGGLAGGVAAGAWSARRRALPFWGTADIYAIYAPLAIAIMRFSCLLDNTCYGGLASPPLGIVFPGLTQPRYPSELYEGLLALLIFGGLLWLGQLKLPRGTLVLAFFVGYPLARALIDLTRINLGGGQLGEIDIFLSVGVAVVAATVLGVRWNRRQKVEPGVSGDNRANERR